MNAEMGYRSDAGALAEVLATVPNDATLYAWLENPTEYQQGLQLRAGVSITEAAALPAEWAQGRLFNDAVDIRWERTTGGIHVVAIAEHLPSTFEGRITIEPVTRTNVGDDANLPAVRAGTERILLWGQQRDGIWNEGRIPGLSDYFSGMDWQGQYAAIEARTYEATWNYDDTMPPAVRIVTRYLRFVS